MLETINTENRKLSTVDRWTEYEKLDHFNVLELKAVFSGLDHFLKCSVNDSNTHVELNG